MLEDWKREISCDDLVHLYDLIFIYVLELPVEKTEKMGEQVEESC